MAQKPKVYSLDSAEAFSTVAIGFALIKKNDEMVITHERDGYYLPAGRVDFGETFATGAIREALEETDLPVNLTYIHCLQFTPGLKNTRIRAFYGAVPKDNTPPKSVPDHEILEAKWMKWDNIKELTNVRSSELYSISDAVLSDKLGKYPVSFVEGTDGSHIDHKECVTALKFGVRGIIRKQGESNTILIMKDSRGLFLPSEFMTSPTTFANAASRLLVPFGVNQINLQGFLRLQHQAPPTKTTPGFVIVTFQAEIDPKSTFQSSSGISLEWKSLTELINCPELIEKEKDFLKNLSSIQLVSPKIFRFESEGII